MAISFLRIKTSHRFVALFTALTFFWTQAAAAAPAIFSDGVTPIEISLPSLNIPSHLAIVKETHGTFSPDAPTFIYIEDAHANYDAQQKIRQLLKWLYENEGFDLALLEGATSPFNADRFRFFANDAYNVEMADALARKGLVTGAELFLLETGKDYRALGIESHDLYVENLKTFRRVLDAKEVSTSYLQAVTRRLTSLENHLLAADAKDLLRSRRAYKSGTQSIFSYLKTLTREADRHLNVDLTDPYAQVEWPQLMRLALMEKYENELDSDHAGQLEREEEAFLENLAALGVEHAHMDAARALFSSRPSESMLERRDVRLVFERMYAAAGPKGFRFEDYPMLTRKIGLLIFRDELIAEELEDEVARLTDRLLDALVKTDTERAVLRLAKDILLLGDAFTLELTPKSVAEFRRRLEALEPAALSARMDNLEAAAFGRGKQSDEAAGRGIETLLRDAAGFYRGTEVRDAFFMKRAFEELEAAKRTKAVLITGGFHSGNITKALREKNASFMVLTPKIDELDKDRSVYYDAMTGKISTRFDRSGILLHELGAESFETLAADTGYPAGRITDLYMDLARDRAETLGWNVNELIMFIARSLAGKSFLDPEANIHLAHSDDGSGKTAAPHRSTGQSSKTAVVFSTGRSEMLVPLVEKTTTVTTTTTSLRLGGREVLRTVPAAAADASRPVAGRGFGGTIQDNVPEASEFRDLPLLDDHWTSLLGSRADKEKEYVTQPSHFAWEALEKARDERGPVAHVARAEDIIGWLSLAQEKISAMIAQLPLARDGLERRETLTRASQILEAAKKKVIDPNVKFEMPAPHYVGSEARPAGQGFGRSGGAKRSGHREHVLHEKGRADRVEQTIRTKDETRFGVAPADILRFADEELSFKGKVGNPLATIAKREEFGTFHLFELVQRGADRFVLIFRHEKTKPEWDPLDIPNTTWLFRYPSGKELILNVGPKGQITALSGSFGRKKVNILKQLRESHPVMTTLTLDQALGKGFGTKWVPMASILLDLLEVAAEDIIVFIDDWKPSRADKDGIISVTPIFDRISEALDAQHWDDAGAGIEAVSKVIKKAIIALDDQTVGDVSYLTRFATEAVEDLELVAQAVAAAAYRTEGNQKYKTGIDLAERIFHRHDDVLVRLEESDWALRLESRIWIETARDKLHKALQRLQRGGSETASSLVREVHTILHREALRWESHSDGDFPDEYYALNVIVERLAKLGDAIKADTGFGATTTLGKMREEGDKTLRWLIGKLEGLQFRTKKDRAHAVSELDNVLEALDRRLTPVVRNPIHVATVRAMIEHLRRYAASASSHPDKIGAERLKIVDRIKAHKITLSTFETLPKSITQGIGVTRLRKILKDIVARSPGGMDAFREVHKAHPRWENVDLVRGKETRWVDPDKAGKVKHRVGSAVAKLLRAQYRSGWTPPYSWRNESSVAAGELLGVNALPLDEDVLLDLIAAAKVLDFLDISAGENIFGLGIRNLNPALFRYGFGVPAPLSEVPGAAFLLETVGAMSFSDEAFTSHHLENLKREIDLLNVRFGRGLNTADINRIRTIVQTLHLDIRSATTETERNALRDAALKRFNALEVNYSAGFGADAAIDAAAFLDRAETLMEALKLVDGPRADRAQELLIDALLYRPYAEANGLTRPIEGTSYRVPKKAFGNLSVEERAAFVKFLRSFDLERAFVIHNTGLLVQPRSRKGGFTNRDYAAVLKLIPDITEAEINQIFGRDQTLADARAKAAGFGADEGVLGLGKRLFDAGKAAFVIADPVLVVGYLAGKWLKGRFDKGDISLDLGEIKFNGIQLSERSLNVGQSLAKGAKLTSEVFDNDAPLALGRILGSGFGRFVHAGMLANGGALVNAFLSNEKLQKKHTEARGPGATAADAQVRAAGFGPEAESDEGMMNEENDPQYLADGFVDDLLLAIEDDPDTFGDDFLDEFQGFVLAGDDEGLFEWLSGELGGKNPDLSGDLQSHDPRLIMNAVLGNDRLKELIEVGFGTVEEAVFEKLREAALKEEGNELPDLSRQSRYAGLGLKRAATVKFKFAQALHRHFSDDPNTPRVDQFISAIGRHATVGDTIVWLERKLQRGRPDAPGADREEGLRVRGVQPAAPQRGQISTQRGSDVTRPPRGTWGRGDGGARDIGGFGKEADTRSVEDVVFDTIREIAKEEGFAIPELTSGTRFIDITGDESLSAALKNELAKRLRWHFLENLDPTAMPIERFNLAVATYTKIGPVVNWLVTQLVRGFRAEARLEVAAEFVPFLRERLFPAIDGLSFDTAARRAKALDTLAELADLDRLNAGLEEMLDERSIELIAHKVRLLRKMIGAVMAEEKDDKTLSEKLPELGKAAAADLGALVVRSVDDGARLDKAIQHKRQPIVGGNLKGKLDSEEKVTKLIQEIVTELGDEDEIDIFIAPSELHITTLRDTLKKLEDGGMIKPGRIHIGAQDTSRHAPGATTGETSYITLKNAGVSYVVVGHSERRHGDAGESSVLVGKKAKKVVESGLTAVLAVGETLDQREAGDTWDVIKSQLDDGLAEFTTVEIERNLVIAYEPVWAIGTGKRATPEQADKVHRLIRKYLLQKYGFNAAASVRIQYGGSVTPDTVSGLIRKPNIDGGLIGGASLVAKDFAGILRETNEHAIVMNAPKLGPTRPDLEEFYRDLTKADTPEYVRENRLFDIVENKGAFKVRIKREHVGNYDKESNPLGLGLEDWLDGYEAEAMLATAGIRLTQNTLFPWDTRHRLNEVGIGLATLAKALVAREKFPQGDIVKMVAGESRYNTRHYMELMARINAGLGIKTLLPKGRGSLPIWMHSFLIFKLDLYGGENVTSSHAVSPFVATKDLNNEGGQYLPEESMEFVRKIREMLEIAKRDGVYEFEIGAENDPLIDDRFMEEINNGEDLYTEYLKQGVANQVNIDRIRNAKRPMIIDNVGGTLHKVYPAILERFGVSEKFEWFRTKQDPYFHGIGKRVLKPTDREVLSGKAKAGEYWDDSQDTTIIIRDKKTGKTLSVPVMERMGYDTLLKGFEAGTLDNMTDPDSDRLVAAQIEPVERAPLLRKLGIEYLRLDEDRIVALYTPNQSFFMTMVYHKQALVDAGLWDKHPRFIIMTTASSTAWAEWAKANDIKVIYVPVGFKEIAAMERKIEAQIAGNPGKQVIVKDVMGHTINLGVQPRLFFAGEESGGMVFGAIEDLIKSNNGRIAVAMREKSAGEAIFIQSAMYAFLEKEGMYISDYLARIFEESDIKGRFDVRHDEVFYNQSQSDPVQLKKDKAAGEKRRSKSYNFYLSMILAFQDKGGQIPPEKVELVKAILSDAFKDNEALQAMNLDFDDLKGAYFVGDGVFLEFPNKVLEIRPSGTDAKSKAYAMGDDKIKLAVFAQALGGYDGTITALHAEHVPEDFSRALRPDEIKPGQSFIYRSEQLAWVKYQAYYEEGLPENSYKPKSLAEESIKTLELSPKIGWRLVQNGYDTIWKLLEKKRNAFLIGRGGPLTLWEVTELELALLRHGLMLLSEEAPTSVTALKDYFESSQWDAVSSRLFSGHVFTVRKLLEQTEDSLFAIVDPKGGNGLTERFAFVDAVQGALRSAGFNELKRAGFGTITEEVAGQRLVAALERIYRAEIADIDGNLTLPGTGIVSEKENEIIRSIVRAGAPFALATARKENVPQLSRNDLKGRGINVHDADEVAAAIRSGLDPDSRARLFVAPENGSYIYWYEHGVRREVDLVRLFAMAGNEQISEDLTFADDLNHELFKAISDHLREVNDRDLFTVREDKRYGFAMWLDRPAGWSGERVSAQATQAAREVQAFLDRHENPLFKMFDAFATTGTIDIMLRGVDKSLAIRFIADRFGLANDEIATTDDKASREGNGWRLTQHPGGFATDEYDPQSEWQVPVSLAIGLKGRGAWRDLHKEGRLKFAPAPAALGFGTDFTTTLEPTEITGLETGIVMNDANLLPGLSQVPSMKLARSIRRLQNIFLRQRRELEERALTPEGRALQAKDWEEWRTFWVGHDVNISEADTDAGIKTLLDVDDVLLDANVDIQNIIEMAEEIRARDGEWNAVKNFVNIGVGGSKNTTHGLVDTLNGLHFNDRSDEARGAPRLYYAGGDFSAARIANLLDSLEERGELFKTIYNVISKSGTTAEPLSVAAIISHQLRLRLAQIRERYDRGEIDLTGLRKLGLTVDDITPHYAPDDTGREHPFFRIGRFFVVTTGYPQSEGIRARVNSNSVTEEDLEKSKSKLFDLNYREHLPGVRDAFLGMIPVPEGTGGRFSTFPVALLALAVTARTTLGETPRGRVYDAIHGAKAAFKEIFADSGTAAAQTIPFRTALIFYLAEHELPVQKKLLDLYLYDPRFEGLDALMAQLHNESVMYGHYGLNLQPHFGPLANHIEVNGMLQTPTQRIAWFLKTRSVDTDRNRVVPEGIRTPATGFPLATVEQASAAGTETSFSEYGLINFSWSIPTLDAFHMGALIYTAETQVAALGEMTRLILEWRSDTTRHNETFLQPSVEGYKTATNEELAARKDAAAGAQRPLFSATEAIEGPSTGVDVLLEGAGADAESLRKDIVAAARYFREDLGITREDLEHRVNQLSDDNLRRVEWNQRRQGPFNKRLTSLDLPASGDPDTLRPTVAFLKKVIDELIVSEMATELHANVDPFTGMLSLKSNDLRMFARDLSVRAAAFKRGGGNSAHYPLPPVSDELLVRIKKYFDTSFAQAKGDYATHLSRLAGLGGPVQRKQLIARLETLRVLPERIAQVLSRVADRMDDIAEGRGFGQGDVEEADDLDELNIPPDKGEFLRQARITTVDQLTGFSEAALREYLLAQGFKGDEFDVLGLDKTRWVEDTISAVKAAFALSVRNLRFAADTDGPAGKTEAGFGGIEAERVAQSLRITTEGFKDPARALKLSNAFRRVVYVLYLLDGDQYPELAKIREKIIDPLLAPGHPKRGAVTIEKVPTGPAGMVTRMPKAGRSDSALVLNVTSSVNKLWIFFALWFAAHEGDRRFNEFRDKYGVLLVQLDARIAKIETWWMDEPVSALGIRYSGPRTLEELGIDTIEKLTTHSRQDLSDPKFTHGTPVSSSDLDKIENALSERGLRLARGFGGIEAERNGMIAQIQSDLKTTEDRLAAAQRKMAERRDRDAIEEVIRLRNAQIELSGQLTPLIAELIKAKSTEQVKAEQSDANVRASSIEEKPRGFGSGVDTSTLAGKRARVKDIDALIRTQEQKLADAQTAPDVKAAAEARAEIRRLTDERELLERLINFEVEADAASQESAQLRAEIEEKPRGFGSGESALRADRLRVQIAELSNTATGLAQQMDEVTGARTKATSTGDRARVDRELGSLGRRFDRVNETLAQLRRQLDEETTKASRGFGITDRFEEPAIDTTERITIALDRVGDVQVPVPVARGFAMHFGGVGLPVAAYAGLGVAVHTAAFTLPVVGFDNPGLREAGVRTVRPREAVGRDARLQIDGMLAALENVLEVEAGVPLLLSSKWIRSEEAVEAFLRQLGPEDLAFVTDADTVRGREALLSKLFSENANVLPLHERILNPASLRSRIRQLFSKDSRLAGVLGSAIGFQESGSFGGDVVIQLEDDRPLIVDGEDITAEVHLNLVRAARVLSKVSRMGGGTALWRQLTDEIGLNQIGPSGVFQVKSYRAAFVILDRLYHSMTAQQLVAQMA